MKSNILVTGGAGYIGSHVLKVLAKQQIGNLVVLDNLSTGNEKFVTNAKLVKGDIRDEKLVLDILKSEKIDAVMHLAAKTSVPESLSQPELYYNVNTYGTLILLEACKKAHVTQFIFSSTAAVYGLPKDKLVLENAPTTPINPYGHSKLMSEQMIQDASSAHGLRYINLRYFNVAGADPEGMLGQTGKKAEHLIKVALETACGKRKNLPIFGNDYPTKDGTCIRDFIHVNDIAQAHVDALSHLQKDGRSMMLNCGYGQGYSVKEVIETVETIVGRPLATTNAPRREGDSPCVVADNEKIKKTLQWKPQFNDLAFIIKTALDWEKKIS